MVGLGLAVRHPPNNVAEARAAGHPVSLWPSWLGHSERNADPTMNTFRRLAAALLFAVPTGISVTALAQPAAISVDREACITSGNAATPEAAIAA
jgi:hypothetical protein